MVFRNNFINALKETKSEYDIIAVCYWELLSYKKDTDKNFITRIGYLAEDSEYGIYAEIFENLRQELLDLVLQMIVNDDNAGISFEELKNKVIQKICQFQCPETLTEDVCVPICIFYIMEALDSYVEKDLEETYDACHDFEPLNKGKSREHCLVYLKEKESFLKEAYSSKGKKGFRKPLHSSRIGSFFHTLLIFTSDKFENVPQVIPIKINRECKSAIKDKIQIFSIPYIGFDTFRFRAINNPSICEADEIRGPFYVEYPPEYEEDNIQRVTALLDLAIQKGANIIIFPEFIMSERMRDAVQTYLRQMQYDKKKRLILVLAGTCYHWDGKSRGNNILHIFNAKGMEVGRYYKYSPFLIQKEERIHGADVSSTKSAGLTERRQYCINCEMLSDPGKECVLLDIEGVGRVLPAICRDVIDGEYTSYLADLFLPSFVLVPAWSESVNSFDTRLKSLADTIHAASLLCNCCNAVKRDKDNTVIGWFYMPAKQNTRMKAKLLNISHNQGCKKLCKERGGCIVQVEVDFSCGQPKSKIIGTYFPNEK